MLDEHLHGAVEARRGDEHRRTARTGAAPRACRTGGSSATRTTSSCSCTAPQADVEALREEIAGVLAPLGLRLSPAKTRVVHMSEGFDFLGFRIQWRRKRGTSKWYVYTFIADRPIRSLKAKIRALTHRTSQQDLGYVLIRLNQIMRGWANYFRHAVVQAHLRQPGPLRLVAGDPVAAGRCTAGGGRTSAGGSPTPHGRWQPITADGIELFNLAAVPVTRYRYRGSTIPSPWAAATTPDGRDRGEPVASETAHGGFGERPGETDREQSRHRAPGRLDGPPCSRLHGAGADEHAR